MTAPSASLPVLENDTPAPAVAPPSAPTSVPGPRRRRGHRRRYLAFAAFTLPNLLLILVFSYVPVVANVGLSFTSWDMISPAPVFVGLSNWATFFTDPQVYMALRTTLIWVVVSVGGSLSLGLLLAVLFNSRPPGGRVASSIIFSPYVLSGAAIGALWLFVFDPRYGLTRVVFDWVGQNSPEWMNSVQWALPGLLIVSVWQGVGFVALVYLAALRGVPQDVREAAALDGAGRFAAFRHVIFPLLSPTTFFLLVTQTIGAFQAFDVIAMMTGGGPARSTTTLSWYIYEQGFQRFDIGASATASVFLFAVLLIVTAVQFGYAEKKVSYQ